MVDSDFEKLHFWKDTVLVRDPEVLPAPLPTLTGATTMVGRPFAEDQIASPFYLILAHKPPGADGIHPNVVK